MKEGIQVRLDPRSEAAVFMVLRDLPVQVRRKIFHAALNRTAARVKTRAGREIAAELGAKVRETGRRLKVYPSTERLQIPEAKVWMGVKALLPRADAIPLPHKPFTIPSKGETQYVRVPPGTGWMPGRPKTSSPNLPIKPVSEWGKVAGRAVAHRILDRVSREQMAQFFPGEVRRLFGVLAAKLRR